MAYDKLIDSVQLNAALTATANAIRAKTHSADPIVWNMETGFAGAISAINADTSTTTILRSDYSPNGTAWQDTATIDLSAGDYIEAEMDLTSCTAKNGNILSIGSVIDTWAASQSANHVSLTTEAVIHFYYPTAANGNILSPELTYVTVSNGSESYGSRKLTTITLSGSKTIAIKIDKDNIYVNGTGIISGSLATTVLPIFASKSSLLVGSIEGNGRSYATYNYIKVVNV